ncbi:hypothetical protein ACKKBF_B18935 [Auxenochlorella protothecoides x Auxenochlorella symbiontica]
MARARVPAGRPGRSRSTKAGAPTTSPLDWLDDYEAVSAWMARHDLHAALEAGDGLAWVPDFLPGAVAEAALACLEAIPPSAWNATAAAEDAGANNIDHEFWSTKSAPGTALAQLLRAFPLLSPRHDFTAFSAARYDARHHIAPHDDRAYTPVLCDDGAIVQCSRDIAVVYYLTRDWRPEFGGAFVDIAGGGKEYCPAFNTAVAFTIPRWHAVTAVVGPRPRFSVFGWFLVPGIAYPLGDGEREAAAGKGPAPERWLEEGEVGRLPQRCKLGRRLLRLESRGLS